MIRLSFKKWLLETTSTLDRPGTQRSSPLEVPPPGEANYDSQFLPYDLSRFGDPKGDEIKKSADLGDGSNPLARVDAWINNLVDSWRGFKPTAERPAPGNGETSSIGDIGAALAGLKVAWIFDALPQNQPILGRVIMSRIKQRIANEDPYFAKNLTYAEPWRGDPVLSGHSLIGPEDKVRKLTRAIKEQQRYLQRDMRYPLSLDREIGELLGYTPESVRQFLDQAIHRNGVNGKPEAEQSRARAMNRLDKLSGYSSQDTEEMNSVGREFGAALGNAPRFPSAAEVEAAPNASAVRDMMRQRRRRQA